MGNGWKKCLYLTLDEVEYGLHVQVLEASIGRYIGEMRRHAY